MFHKRHVLTVTNADDVAEGVTKLKWNNCLARFKNKNCLPLFCDADCTATRAKGRYCALDRDGSESCRAQINDGE